MARMHPFGNYPIRQQRITGTVQEIANAHENNRQSEIKRTLLHLFLMAKVKLIPMGSTVSFSGAEVQYITATTGDNAAHCVPCQILINGNTPLSIVEPLSDELYVELAQIFGATDVIRVNFNKADSLAEVKGLKEAFRASCERALQLGHRARFQYIEQILPNLATIFDVYKTDGGTAFQSAITHMQTRIPLATGAKRTEREERATILRHYQHKLDSATSTLETVLSLNPQDLWASYREAAP